MEMVGLLNVWRPLLGPVSILNALPSLPPAVRVPADVPRDAALQDAPRDHLGQRPLQGEPLPRRGPDPAGEGGPIREGEHAVVQAGKLLGKILSSERSSGGTLNQTAGRFGRHISMNRTKNHPHFISDYVFY